MLERLRERHGEGGFTLVEVLVVVAILGVLASVAVVAVGGASRDGREAACKSDVATVQAASDAYFAKNAAYAADLPALVTADYLRTVPTGNGYTVEYTAATGLASSTPADCNLP